jgi:serine/threonine-protein kinase
MLERLPTPPAPWHPLVSIGDWLGGHYRIEAIVRALPGDVWLEVTDVRVGRRLEAQVLVSEGTAEALDADSARSVFLAAAARARALLGVHVARVLDSGVTLAGHPWLVSEPASSPSLSEQLAAHGPLATEDAVDVAIAVADALAEAHRERMVHGALGPHCVHFTLSDVGPKDVRVRGMGTAQAASALTLGTAGHVDPTLRSPEQLRLGYVRDPRTDVWALGVLLHTMITGQSPFPADTPSGASLAVILDEAPSLDRVPEELAHLVRSALARDPSERPDSVLDFAEALLPFARDGERAGDILAARRTIEAAGWPSPASFQIVESLPALRETMKDGAPVAAGRVRRRGLLGAAGIAAMAASVIVILAAGSHAVRPEPVARPALGTAMELELPPTISLPETVTLHDPRTERASKAPLQGAISNQLP